MEFQILVSNKSGLPKAEIVTIVDGDHVWTENEGMQAFLDGGGLFDDWSRQFSVVKGTGATAADMQYLKDYNDQGERKYFFIEPAQSTEIWQELYLTGEVKRPVDVILSFIGQR